MEKQIYFRGIGLLPLAGLLPQMVLNANGQSKATLERPNIVFILADDLGYGDISCFGSQFVKTPNIDNLSKTGTTFTQCYAGSAISSPSRCSLLTGKNTGNTTIRDNFCKAGGIKGKKVSPDGSVSYIRRMNLLPTDTTIATVLRSAGYKTCLVNKWHLDGFNPEATPLNRGFDEFHGWLISTIFSNDPYYYPYWRFDNDKLINIEANAHDKHVMHNTDFSTEDAINFIRKNKDRPFFLYLAYDAPHEPYIIDDTSWYDGENWDMNTKRYAALITHMDAAIGRLMKELERLKLRKNTLVVFASDNGAAVQAPLKLLKCNGVFRGRKGLLYEGGIRVPLIVNQPGKIPVRTLENIIYFPDMMPTFAALTGSNKHLPQHLNGINILPLFYGKQLDTDHRLLYWEFPGVQRAARKGDWKCVTTKRGAPLELYNIKEDMEERHNLADQYPEMVKEFDKEMKAIRHPSPNWPLEGE
ncbi:sulfatase-like hydrolase/transferase [Segatella buccae]|uniref:sulfatase-like hydrolase/transferase n=1 Tax=Segatella buccae TaxID=28126 RepID=UPI0027B8DDC3|nr:sulfatase-like hydrolase/transferase [Segatella buccae]